VWTALYVTPLLWSCLLDHLSPDPSSLDYYHIKSSAAIKPEPVVSHPELRRNLMIAATEAEEGVVLVPPPPGEVQAVLDYTESEQAAMKLPW